jgi:hypothetical protein
MAKRYLNTKITKSPDTTTVKLHDTIIVEFTPNLIHLNTGGWNTTTTKRRMNQIAEQFKLGYRVFSENFQWYVRIFDTGQEVPFNDSITFFNYGDPA